MKKLYILRHGETEFNAQNRYAGTLDIELSEKGIEQSRKAAATLAAIPIDIIYSSSKKRAYRTAQIINEHISKPLYKSGLLIERNLGVYEGLTRKEAKEKYPGLWERNVLYDERSTEHGGESVLDVKKRAQKVMDEIVGKYPGKNILLVTHGYISRMINFVILNLSEDETNKFLLGNCEMVQYNIE